MSEILVAEDSATQAAHIRALLQTAGYDVRVAIDGVTAMESLAEKQPEAVLTDLDMPRMNGLDLVMAARREYPQIPVILMTAFGSEEIAVQALQAGAASYVPKKNLANDLINTLREVLEVSRARREDARVAQYLEGIDAKFDLPNLANQAMAVVGYVQESMATLGLGDETERLRLGIALDAAIQNAMYLGNLELSQRQVREAHQQTDSGKSFLRLVHERDSQPPYRDRRVHVSVNLWRSGLKCTVGHDGPGFDAKAALEAEDALELAHSRDAGWVLVKSLVGKLSFDTRGNEVTLSRESHMSLAPQQTLTAVIAEDSATQAVVIRQRVQRCGFSVRWAANGEDALALVRQQVPALVLTDLEMPVMNGLELTRELNSEFPGLPIVLMTADGSEEVAVQALRAGAANYVPKQRLDHDLPRVLEGVLAIVRANKGQYSIGQCLTETGSHYLLPNDVSLIPPLVARLQKNLERQLLFSASEQMRMGIALREALMNAIEHGNLELSSQLRETDDDAYRKLAAERRNLEPYRDRRVHLKAIETRHGVTFTIADDGPGFDPASLPDPTDPANLEKASGRGLLLVRSFMDEVSHNAQGNQITLTKFVSG